MTEPRHPQLMDPVTDPEEFIESSIYWYPSIFPTRTEVLDHLFLCNGNGYEWNSRGEIRSVFAHIEPRDTQDYYERDIRKYAERGWNDMAEELRKLQDRDQLIREHYRPLARTYGPIRDREMGTARRITSYDLSWTLLGRTPDNASAIWLPLITEVRALFAEIFTEQGELW